MTFEILDADHDPFAEQHLEIRTLAAEINDRMPPKRILEIARRLEVLARYLDPSIKGSAWDECADSGSPAGSNGMPSSRHETP